jgi:hypothetical protein
MYFNAGHKTKYGAHTAHGKKFKKKTKKLDPPEAHLVFHLSAKQILYHWWSGCTDSSLKQITNLTPPKGKSRWWVIENLGISC